MSQLRNYFLGPFRVMRDDQTVIGFESDKGRALLAYLLVEPGRPHRREALAALLWPEQTDAAARQSLRQTLYMLRRTLSRGGAAGARPPEEDDTRAAPGPLLVTRQTVQVHPASATWCDVALFNHLLAACKTHSQQRSGHPDRCLACVERFHQATELYRGDFLQRFLVADSPEFEEWLLLERETHHRQMMYALERLADYYEEVGEHEQALHFARWQLQLEPWREEAHRQVMRLLSRTGQRSTALAQYEACRQALAAELGLAPARETIALYERIRDAETEVRMAAPLVGMRFLPLAPTPLIGREAEVTAVGERLLQDEVRLLTVTGPGGVGKTRVALQAAAGVQGHFAQGTYFVNLAPLTDAGLVGAEIAAALGVTEQREQGVLASIAAYLQGKEVLLLLDNFEQVADAAPQVSGLLAGCPRLKVLVTSRVPLGVRGERECPVPPLALPDLRRLPPLERLAQYEAVRLFSARARDVRPDFQLTPENGPAVAEICVRLDGLPLAIELAAARARILSPAALLARLSHRLRVLTRGALDLPTRQQTMRNTIAWSYDLLDAGEQQLLRRMAPFSGGRSLDALETVCNYDGQLGIDVVAGAGSLVSKNLLREVAGHDGEPRFWMLETIHEYAREKLGESGDAGALAREHACYFMRLAEEAEPHLTGKEQQTWLDRLEGEYDNLRAALEWAAEQAAAGDVARGRAGDTAAAAAATAAEAGEVGLRLAGALYRFWYIKGLFREGREYLEQALSVWEAVDGAAASTGAAPGRALPGRAAPIPPGPARSRSKAKALNGAASLAERQGDDSAARAAVDAALVLGRASGDRETIGTSLHIRGTMTFMQGDYAAARGLYAASLALRRELGDTWGIASALNGLGIVATEQGDFVAARALHEESLALRRELGDKWGISTSLHNLGFVAKQLSDYAGARAHCEESLALRRELGDRPGVGMSLHNLAVVAKEQGEYARARALYEESLALRRELGDKRGTGLSLHQLAVVAMEEGDHARARALFDESLVLLREVGDKQTMAWCLSFLGAVAHDEGDYARARTLYEAGLAGNTEVGSKMGMAWPTGRLGLLAMEGGDYAGARTLLEASLALSLEMGNRKGTVAWLAGLGGVAAGEGQRERGATVLGAVDRLVPSLGVVLDRVDRLTYERRVQHARALLDEAAFARAWEVGQAMSLEAAVEYARHPRVGSPP